MQITYKDCLKAGYKNNIGPISYFLLKPLQCLVAYILIKLTKGKISPNLVTLSNIFLYLFTAYFILNKNFLAAALMLLLVHDLLDGVDGCIARLLNKTSKVGAFLDSFIYTSIYYVSLVLIAFVTQFWPEVLIVIILILLRKNASLAICSAKLVVDEQIFQSCKVIFYKPMPDTIYFVFLIFCLLSLNVKYWLWFLIIYYIFASVYEGFKLMKFLLRNL